jgi:hypothetical protein
MFLLGIYFLISNNIHQWNNIKDVLIKNLNWDSPLQNDVPFVKGNDLELYYIIDNDNGNSADINIEKLQEKLDIEKIEIWDTLIDIKNNINIKIDQTTPLKITGKAKINNDDEVFDLKDLVDIKVTQEEAERILVKTWSTIEQKEIETDEKIIEIEEKINNDFSKFKLSNTQFNSNINNLLELSWDNIENIKYLNIGSYSINPVFKDNKAFFLINKDTFNSWNYFVFIQPTEWKIVPLNEQITFKYSNSIVNIANITPNEVKNDKDRYIVLQWNGFSKIVSIQLNNNIVIKKTSFEVINDKVLSIKIQKWLQTGTYSFNIMTTDEIVELNNLNFSVIQ